MKLGKHIFSIGIITAISRVFGFVRDMLIANFLGAGRLSDIFVTAFKLPNLFRDLLGEGALSTIFVPMFTKQNKDKAFAENVFSWLMIILLGITILFEIFMPVIIMIFAPGFADDPGKMELTVTISRIMFFYVIFVCGSALLSAVLNAFSKFALSAFMPVMLNIMLIGAMLLAGFYSRGAVLYVLAWTVVLAGIVQMIVLWARIRRQHFGLRLIVPKWTPQIKTVFKRFGVSIFGNGFYQINIFIGTLIASFQSGAVSWLYYSDRIVQLPFAIIGLASGTVLLSSISDAIAKNNIRSVHLQQNSAIRRSMMLIMPCVVGLFVLAHPIIHYLFERGAWTPESTHAVALAIMIQVLSLPFMILSNIYSRTLYATQDVRTPVKISIIGLISAIILYFSLFWFIGYLAIPAGTLVSSIIRNYLLSRTCRKRGLFQNDKKTSKSVIAFTLLSVALGSGLWFVPITSFWVMIIAIISFAAVYLPIAYTINKKL